MKQILFFISVLFSSVIYSQTISNVTPSSGRVDSCVSQSITWDSSGTSDYYNIYYSVDNGANWISIATSYNTISNTFSWTVPNVSSVNSHKNALDYIFLQISIFYHSLGCNSPQEYNSNKFIIIFAAGNQATSLCLRQCCCASLYWH